MITRFWLSLPSNKGAIHHVDCFEDGEIRYSGNGPYFLILNSKEGNSKVNY
jgi:hypothetical protein